MICRCKMTWLGQAAALVFAAGIVAGPSAAQSPAPADGWNFDAILYGYLPKIDGSTTFPTGTTANIGVDASQIIHNLKFTVMGTLQAQKGPLVLFTDLLYVDVSGSKSATRDFSVGGPLGHIEIPAAINADFTLDIKSTLWTLAWGYRLVASPETTLDLFAGARLLQLKQNLGWQFNADLGPFMGPGRQGSSEVSANNWDGIIGAKGRFSFGDRREWFVPYYVDVGTGQSQLTWQAYGGLGYNFDWGSVFAVWRYIDYRFNSSEAFGSLSMNGPALGVALHW